jgi:antitoxin component HigA of HigAB toxin-antitoxin module
VLEDVRRLCQAQHEEPFCCYCSRLTSEANSNSEGPPSTGNLIRHLMDQHGLTRADMVPILGTPSRVSEVLGGKKGLSMAMVQRLRARFHVPDDLLFPPLKKAPASRSTKQAAA